MRRVHVSLVVVAVLAILVLATTPTLGQEEEIPRADIITDEGGPVRVTGSFPISSQNIIDSTYQSLVILEDQAGFVDRNLDYVFPVESQVIAAFTSPFQVGTITYELNLPAEPRGAFRDVDNDGEDDTGVQIFQIAWWDNRFESAYLEERDGHGWSTAWGTVSASIHPDALYEYTGGNVIVWAPDDEQGFPAGFGEDGLLFTEDDPVVLLPAGYTIVNMDTDPFTYDRSREAVLNLIEPEEVVPYDFSEMSYADAFNALVEVAINEYAFTEYKGVDWEGLREEFLPRFEEADTNEDNAAYLFALRDFAWSIPDGHVAVYGPQAPLDDDFIFNTDGGLGIAALELDDGRIVVSFLLPDGPADDAGVQLLAELIEFGSVPIEEAMATVVPYSSPFSAEAVERHQQLRYLLAGQVGSEVEITYQNPGDAAPTTVSLTRVAERESFGFSSVRRGITGLEPAILYEFLEDGIGYVQITDFSGHEPLLIETLEAFLRTANRFGAPAVIFDMRHNTGGSPGYIPDMASYFFTETTPVKYTEEYNREIDAFFYDERFPLEVEPPLDESLLYEGPIVMLIGQDCVSACELFVYTMSLRENVTTVGQYATQGAEGGWPLLYMPDGIIFALPTSRPIDMDGNILIEGVGIVPEVHVPVDEDTILRANEDIVLEAAIDYIYLMQRKAAEAACEGAEEIVLGEPLSGELTADAPRVRFMLPALAADMTVDFLTESEIDTYLRIYYAANNQLAFEVPFPIREIDIPAGLDLIIEVGSENDDLIGPFVLIVQESVPVEWTAQDVGTIAIGDTVEGELSEGLRFRYRLEVEADTVIDIRLGDEAGELDTYLRIYAEDNLEEPVFENDDIDPGVERNSLLLGIEVTAGQVLIIEVGGFGDYAEGPYTLTVTEAGE